MAENALLRSYPKPTPAAPPDTVFTSVSFCGGGGAPPAPWRSPALRSPARALAASATARASTRITHHAVSSGGFQHRFNSGSNGTPP